MKLVAAHVIVILLFLGLSAGFARAANLLDRPFADASKHDFVEHFQFVEKSKMVSKDVPITEHLYASAACGGMLALGVTTQGRIVHMRLGIPRELIDDPKHTILGRDVVKSFIESCATTRGDWQQLKMLSDEVYVRGLDLHPVPLKTEKFADTGKPVPDQVGYKVGPGPVKKGDQLVLIDKLPVLSAKPSDEFLAITGKTPQATEILQNCRIGFASQKGQAGRPDLLMCDVWDEQYWRAHVSAPASTSQAQTK